MNLLYLYISADLSSVNRFLYFCYSQNLPPCRITLFFCSVSNSSSVKINSVLTDIIYILLRFFFAKLGMVRQKIAFLCIGIHAAFHSCFDLSSGRCSKKRHLLHWLQKKLCHNEIWIYFYFCLFMCYFIYRNTYTHLLQKGSRI